MKHYAIALLILLATTGVHLNITRAQAKAAAKKPPQNVLNIPATIGSYRQVGEDFAVSEEVRRTLQATLILMRSYVSPTGWPIQLSIVYAGTSRRSLHFPEVCLVGQGWEIREQHSMPVGFSFTAKRLVLVQGGRKEAVLYWFKTGEQLTGNFFLNSWFWAKNQVLFGSPTSAMIRLSSPVGRQDEEAVFALLEDFATKFTPILMERVK